MSLIKNGILINHGKPRTEKSKTYFCRLCRKYDIKTRLAHLENYHKTDRATTQKRANKDLIEIIFVSTNKIL